jgi:hypothetical protein
MPALATICRDSNSKNLMRRGTLVDRRASRLPAVLRPLLLALLALAVLPAAASAAIIDIQVTPKGGADYGETHAVTGKMTGPYGAPLVGRDVELEIRAYPYKTKFRSVAKAMTGLDGRFAFERAFPKNHQVRVFAPQFGDRSAVARVYVFPRTDLTFVLARRNVIRLIQTYVTPKGVRLTAPTLFYVGRQGKRTAPLAAKAKTRPVRKKGRRVRGRFRATALVRIPKAWKGRFRYASCFPYNGGMGDPRLGCPKRKYKF